MSSTTRLIDVTTRHQIFLQRYAGGESKKAVKLLNSLRRQVNARLLQEPTQFQAQRLTDVLTSINALYAKFNQNLTETVRTGINAEVVSEAQFSQRTYNQVATVNFTLPSNDDLIAAVTNAPMNISPGGRAITIYDAIKQFSESAAEGVGQAIRDGIALGDTTPQISRKVAELMGTTQKRQVDAVVRTAVNHASQVAKQELTKRNSDIVTKDRWVSVLDSRTSLVCAGRDGEEYDVGVGPRPPAHYNCRSDTVPVIDPAFRLDELLPGGTRTSRNADGEIEFISARKTYGGWLKQQPPEVIDEVLGVERSRLFRSGKLSIDKFTDPTGRTYTLKELGEANEIAAI